jgi:hypothetical protein
VLITRSLVEADLLAGRTKAALRRLALVNDHPGMQYQSFWSALLAPVSAWADLELSHGDAARDKIEVCESYARAHVIHLLLPDILRIRALIALGDARWQEATAALDEAYSFAHETPLPWAELKALWVYGQLEVARGNPAAAHARFAAALAICERLGERLYRPHIERSLAAL